MHRIQCTNNTARQVQFPLITLVAGSLSQFRWRAGVTRLCVVFVVPIRLREWGRAMLNIDDDDDVVEIADNETMLMMRLMIMMTGLVPWAQRVYEGLQKKKIIENKWNLWLMYSNDSSSSCHMLCVCAISRSSVWPLLCVAIARRQAQWDKKRSDPHTQKRVFNFCVVLVILNLYSI